MITVEQKKDKAQMSDRIIVEKFGLTKPAMFIEGMNRDLHIDSILNPSEFSESISQGVLLLSEMKKAAQTITPAEIFEQMTKAMPEFYENIRQLPHGEQSFHEAAGEYLVALTKS